MFKVADCLNDWRESRFLKSFKPLSEYSKVTMSEQMGRGVEVSVPVSAGSLLGVYPGEYKSIKAFLEKEEFVSRSVKSAFMISEDTIIDPTDIFGYLPDRPELRLALINEPPAGERINVFPVSSRKHVWYVAISNLEAGQQLYTNYGPVYSRAYETSNLNTRASSLSDQESESLRFAARVYPWLGRGVLELFKFS